MPGADQGENAVSTHVPGQSEPEYLGIETPATTTRPRPSGKVSRRGGIVAAASVAVVAAVGVGAYGVVQFMSGGSSPATAVPASAVGYLSLDLDPSGPQKLEAFKLMRKFPALKSELGSTDDLRRTLFEDIQEESDCKDLSYEEDVEPWIGNRIAVAAVPDGDKPAPLVVLQVTDQAKAKAGVRALAACGDDAATGISFVGDYLLLAETQKQVDAMAADAQEATLADSPGFTTAMDRTGEPGIISMYASPDAPQALVDAEGDAMSSAPGVSRQQSRQLQKVLKDFEGAAGVVRFHDGAVEAEFSAAGLPGQTTGTGGDSGVSELPSTTAAVFAMALPSGWIDQYLDVMKDSLPDGMSLNRAFREGERATGLRLPQDIETLLGEGVSVSVDGSANLRKLVESPDPRRIPAGIRIKGDPDKIRPIITKLKKAAGPQSGIVKVRSGDDSVAIGLSRRYVKTLAGHGGLGSLISFQDAVPNADAASGVFYLNFDAGSGWADQLADVLSDGDPKVRSNIAPLDALGISSWQDGPVQHALLRLTTD
jgi:Protein of unknown function (DUF3352)